MDWTLPQDSARPKGKGNVRSQVLMLVSDPVVDRLYRKALRHEDYCAVWCERQSNWKKALISFDYSVIVVDFSFFNHHSPIHSLEEVISLCPDSEIIVLSPTDDVRIAIAAFQMGVADYLLKPTNPETLSCAIEKLVERQNLRRMHEGLSADLRLFNIIHQLNAAESDAKMRALGMKNLLQLLHAVGGAWLLPKTSEDNGQELSFLPEYYSASTPKAKHALERFQNDHPDLLHLSFNTQLTGHPEHWIHGSQAWIPLRSPSLGAIFLYDIRSEVTGALLARIEFLIRNLEASVENHYRYLKARQLSYIDDLTGLYNSRYLDVALTAAIDAHTKAQTRFSLLFIDIDRFKSVNDNRGHLVGSRLLTDLAKLLRSHTRKEDHVFRYGGDEFIAVLYGADVTEAMRTAERLRAETEKHRFITTNGEIRITLSIGVAAFPDHAAEKKKILKLADDAMYNSKRKGRNSVCLADVSQT